MAFFRRLQKTTTKLFLFSFGISQRQKPWLQTATKPVAGQWEYRLDCHRLANYLDLDLERKWYS
jgi:hypothetical protein